MRYVTYFFHTNVTNAAVHIAEKQQVSENEKSRWMNSVDVQPGEGAGEQTVQKDASGQTK